MTGLHSVLRLGIVLTLLCVSAAIGFFIALGHRPPPHLALGVTAVTGPESGTAMLTIDVNNATGDPLVARLRVDAADASVGSQPLWADEVTIVPGRTTVKADVRGECGRQVELRLEAGATVRQVRIVVPCPPGRVGP